MSSIRGRWFLVLVLAAVANCINPTANPVLARAAQDSHAIGITHLSHSVLDQRPIIRKEGARLLGRGMELHSAVDGVALSSEASDMDPDMLKADAALANQLDTPENVQERDPKLFEEMTCPGEWRERAGFQQPFLCPTAMKKVNCSWSDEDAALGAICDENCFCAPEKDLANSSNASSFDINDFNDNTGFYEEGESAASVSVNIQQCKRMCKGIDPCYFTFITDEVGQKGECRVYTQCEDKDKEVAPPELANASNGNVWKTCERFFGNYTNRAIALHSPLYNRFVEFNKKGDALQNMKEEMNINMRPQNNVLISLTVTSTENISEINKAGEDESHETDESSLKEAQAMGGPGTIALYNRGRWVTFDNEGALVGDEQVSPNSLFTVCYLGPGQIALFNQATKSYIQMTSSGMESTGRTTCCKPPKDFEGVRFSVVTLD